MEHVVEGRRWRFADVESRLRLVVDAARRAALLIGDDGRILMANSRAAAVFGYGPDELAALELDALLPGGWGARNDQPSAPYAVGPVVPSQAPGIPLAALRKDGSTFRVMVVFTPVVLDDVHVLLASVADDLVGPAQTPPAPRGRVGVDPQVLAAIPFSVIATDAAGEITEVNRKALQLLGRSREELVGKPLSMLDAAVGRRAETLAHSLDSAADAERERDYLRGDGTVVPVNEGITRLCADDGTTSGYLVVAYDITKYRQAQSALLFMASHDALTNLPNRSLLVRHLVGEIARAKEEGTQVALVLLDLDHFKRINDSMGHHAGDVLLLQVADRLKRWARGADMVARLGGDEFVILFTGVEDVDTLTTTLHGLLRDLTTPVEVGGSELAITVSAGGVLCPRDADNPSSVLRLADTAMYHTKSVGRNGFAWFSSSMREEADERAVMASALRVAIQREELSVAYQPQVDLATGLVVGFEALARWNGPNGPVSPERFIPVAEESGMMVELGAWVLDRACADIVSISAALGRPLRIAVNCSPQQLHSAEWLPTVRSALDRSGLSPDQLELEITEGVLMDERWNVHEVLSELRDLGVAIAVDDFGQGYSSLAYLTRFPITTLKIDRAFVQRIEAEAPQAPIVDAVIDMAHALGMEVTAEGVESEHQATYLLGRGCERGQGFLYARGLVLEDALAYVLPDEN